MSAGSSRRRQLTESKELLSSVRGLIPQRNTRGELKGPAKREKEIVTILRAKREALANLELDALRVARSARIKRLVRWALALLAGFLIAAALCGPRAARAEWSEDTRAAVQSQCRGALPAAPPGFCACYARELERLSPEPDEPATAAQVRAALVACVPLATEI